MSKGRRIARIPNFEPSAEERTRYLLHWEARQLFHAAEELPQLTPEFLFGTPAPFVLEIGCGTGELLCTLAAENPGRNYFGVDRSRRSLYYAVRLAAQNTLTNIRFLQADFLLALPRLAPASIAAALLLFPDPNPASRHRKRRVFQPALLDALHPALTEEATLLVVSDDEPLFMDMLALAESDPRYRKTHPERFLEGYEPPVKTRFQRAWEEKGKVIRRFELEQVHTA